jgi:serine/threonine-protein kinase HipA
MSTLRSCIEAAPDFLLSEGEAISIIEQQIVTIAGEWDAICDIAKMTETDRKLFAGRQFLNPFCLVGLTEHQGLQDAFLAARAILIGDGDT